MARARRDLAGFLRCLVLLAGAAAAVAARILPAHAQSPEEVVKVRVEVTDTGFKPATVEVEAGKLVELTFVWAHQAYPNDEHIIVLEGYKLETEKITASHREATIRFVADKPGTFTFKCDLECEVHQLTQNGRLSVKAGRGGTAARVPTVLTVKPLTDTVGPRGVDIVALLKDANGAPVPKAELRFFLEAKFLTTQGLIELGRAKTDASGMATWEYRPTVDMPEHKLVVRFESAGVYDESEQALSLRQAAPPPAAYVPAPTGFVNAPSAPLPGAAEVEGEPWRWLTAAWSWSLNNWGPLTILLVVATVWGAMAYTVYTCVYSGARPGRGPRPGGGLLQGQDSMLPRTEPSNEEVNRS